MPKFTVHHMDWSGPKHMELTRDLYKDQEARFLDAADYNPVAIVECADREMAFQLTNTIDGPWWENHGVTIVDKTRKGFRSTSVTDVIIDESGMLHLCAPFGWVPAYWKEKKS